MRHRRRVDEREQHQDEIERVHRQRTIMLRPLWSDKQSQDMEIKDFSVSAPEMIGGEARVTVNFKNLDKPTRVVFMLSRTANSWKISDIRYDDGSSLKKILEGKL